MKLKSFWQFVKFAVVGVANTLVDWLVFYFLILQIIPDERFTAKAISFVVAAVNSFILNSIWTFRQEFYSGIKNKSLRFYKITNYFFRFFIVSLVGFAINYLTFRFAIGYLEVGNYSNYANIFSLIAASGSALVWNFFINKVWTYNSSKIENFSASEQSETLIKFRFDLIAAAIIALMVGISVFAMRGDSAIVDEVAHIPAGYSYVKFQDFRLNPEHPPLAKFIAGAPLTILNLSDPRIDSSWKIANQWDNGWYFLYRSGNNADQMLFWARIPMLLFLIFLGVILYRWASELFGNKTALFILVLYAFTPDFIAHGHFVTTDVAAAFGFLLASYAFYHYLEKNSWRNFILAVLALGVAQLLKFSAFLLFPIFLTLVFAKAHYQSKDTGKKYLAVFWEYFKQLVLIALLSIFVVWIFYIPLVWNTPAEIEKQVILKNLTDNPSTLILRNFLYHFADNPFLRGIGHYLLGLMLVFGRVAGGNSTFILGHFSDKAISWFFPVAWLIKTPLVIVVLTLFSFLYGFIWKKKTLGDKWLLFVILTPFVIYWAVTLKGSLNIGTRHLLPTLPFLYLFIGFAMRDIIESKKIAANITVIALVFFLAVPVLAAFPNYLGYLNSFTSTTPGYKVLVDSSLDWGQDLKRLKNYVDENQIPEADIKIDYFGGGLVSYYMPEAKEWRSGYGPTSGWLAISATFYQMSKLQSKAEGKWSYDWLERYQPVKVAGTGILLFYIPPDELIKNPPISPYSITKYDLPKKVGSQNNQL